MELLNLLTEKLGVTQEQAKGGVGMLLKMAQDKLNPDEFSKVAALIPGFDDLISSAPKAEGLSGALGGLTSSLGGLAGSLGDLAQLKDGFKNLGLDSGMIAKFVPVILAFVESHGGDKIKGLLSSVLK